MSPWILAVIAAQSLDLTTTTLALHQGCVESTYFAKSAGGILAVKGGATVALSFTLPIMGKSHPKAAKGAALAMIGSGVLGGVLNLRTLPKCHR